METSIKCNAVYKFNNNLLKLSNDKNIDNALMEWQYICNDEKTDQFGLCICQHKIKNIYFMYNKITKNTISVGIDCYKKFGFNKNNKINNYILKSVYKKFLKKGEYEFIDNIINYVKNIEKELIKCIIRKYKKICQLYTDFIKIYKLKNLISTIDNLINEYDIEYLVNIYNKIKKEEKLENDKLDKFIRIKLGQTIFPTPNYEEYNNLCDTCENKENNKCYIKCYNNYDYNNWKHNGHLRFNFDARDDYDIKIHNKKIIELFNDFYKDKKCIIHSRKGFIFIKIITNNNYNKYDYYHINNYINDDEYPYIAILSYSGGGTVDIIQDLLLRINNNNYKLEDNDNLYCEIEII